MESIQNLQKNYDELVNMRIHLRTSLLSYISDLLKKGRFITVRGNATENTVVYLIGPYELQLTLTLMPFTNKIKILTESVAVPDKNIVFYCEINQQISGAGTLDYSNFGASYVEYVLSYVEDLERKGYLI